MQNFPNSTKSAENCCKIDAKGTKMHKYLVE